MALLWSNGCFELNLHYTRRNGVMQFRTAIDISKCVMPPLKHSDGVLMLGSCFSDKIGARLINGMVDVVVNPFGTTYNPLSLSSCVEWLVSGRMVADSELFAANGVYNHFMFHSRFSGVDAQGTAQAMNASLAKGRGQLASCSHLFVTLGTSFVYRLADSGEVVNNCHKLPSSRFLRSLCSIDELTSAIGSIATMVHEFNPAAKVVFTVSPIRHLADGLAMNHLSKSLLTVATHTVVSANAGYCYYFPAFEILNDDLRDYRFYAADMAHPSELAVDYIWTLFKEAFFAPVERQGVEQCERLSRMLAHRPVNPNADVVAQFRRKCASALAEVIRQWPHIAKLDYLSCYNI